MKSIKKANIQKNRCFFSSKSLGTPTLRKKRGGWEEEERENVTVMPLLTKTYILL